MYGAYSLSLNSRLSIGPPIWLIIRCICDTSNTDKTNDAVAAAASTTTYYCYCYYLLLLLLSVFT